MWQPRGGLAREAPAYLPILVSHSPSDGPYRNQLGSQVQHARGICGSLISVKYPDETLCLSAGSTGIVPGLPEARGETESPELSIPSMHMNRL